jgi:DNA-binding MarR family transcriptional regulator
MSSAQLAVRSFVSAQSGNEIVAALERMGYIERTPDSTNSRILRIQLTDEGIAMVNRCDAAVDELEAKMLRGIAPGDVRLVSRTLDAVIENLS